MKEKKIWTKPQSATLTKEEINKAALASGCSKFWPHDCPFNWHRQSMTEKERA